MPSTFNRYFTSLALVLCIASADAQAAPFTYKSLAKVDPMKVDPLTELNVKKGLRLVEFANEDGITQRSWVTEKQMDRLNHLQHEIGRCPGFLDLTDHQLPPVSQEFMAIESLLHEAILKNRDVKQPELVN